LLGVAGAGVEDDLLRAQTGLHLLDDSSDLLGREQREDHPRAIPQWIVGPLGSSG